MDSYENPLPSGTGKATSGGSTTVTTVPKYLKPKRKMEEKYTSDIVQLPIRTLKLLQDISEIHHYLACLEKRRGRSFLKKIESAGQFQELLKTTKKAYRTFLKSTDENTESEALVFRSENEQETTNSETEQGALNSEAQPKANDSRTEQKEQLSELQFHSDLEDKTETYDSESETESYSFRADGQKSFSELTDLPGKLPGRHFLSALNSKNKQEELTIKNHPGLLTFRKELDALFGGFGRSTDDKSKHSSVSNTNHRFQTQERDLKIEAEVQRVGTKSKAQDCESVTQSYTSIKREMVNTETELDALNTESELETLNSHVAKQEGLNSEEQQIALDSGSEPESFHSIIQGEVLNPKTVAKEQNFGLELESLNSIKKPETPIRVSDSGAQNFGSKPETMNIGTQVELLSPGSEFEPQHWEIESSVLSPISEEEFQISEAGAGVSGAEAVTIYSGSDPVSFYSESDLVSYYSGSDPVSYYSGSDLMSVYSGGEPMSLNSDSESGGEDLEDQSRAKDSVSGRETPNLRGEHEAVNSESQSEAQNTESLQESFDLEYDPEVLKSQNDSKALSTESESETFGTGNSGTESEMQNSEAIFEANLPPEANDPRAKPKGNNYRNDPDGGLDFQSGLVAGRHFLSGVFLHCNKEEDDKNNAK